MERSESSANLSSFQEESEQQIDRQEQNEREES